MQSVAVDFKSREIFSNVTEKVSPSFSGATWFAATLPQLKSLFTASATTHGNSSTERNCQNIAPCR